MPFIPTPDTLPTPWGYFQFLLLLTFPLHLLLMNALIGSSAVAVYAHLKGQPQSRALAYELAKAIPLLVALTVNLGVAPLLFLQVLYGHLIYASSILMGLFWIMIIPALLIAYYATYWYDFRFAALGRAGIAVLFGALLVLLGIGFLFSNNMTLMLRPETWSAYLEQPGGTLLNTADPVLWPRYLHFIVGGMAVGGLFVAVYGRFLAKRDRSLGDYATALGKRLFLALTMVQILVGAWFLMALPRSQRLLFMGGDALATGCFVVALALLAGLLVAALRDRLALTGGLLVGLLYVMAFMRDFLRAGYLREVFHPGMLTVVPEYSPLLLFVATLVVGLALVAWMLRAVLTRSSG